MQLVTRSVLSKVKLGWWKALSFWKQKTYIWWYLRVLDVILWNHSGTSGAALSLSHQFIGRPQQIKLFVFSTWWGHYCVLPAYSPSCLVKPGPSEATHYLPNEDFWKCYAGGWPQYIPEDVACSWGIRGWSTVTNINFESIYVINSWAADQL